MNRLPGRALLILVITALAACALALASGSAGMGWVSEEIFWQLRVPRMLAGFGAGAALGLAGALMQLLTRNPLADPYVLGVSGGASVGALTVLALGLSTTEWALAAGAGVGACAATAALFGLAWRWTGAARPLALMQAAPSLVLMGVMIGSAASAVVALLLTLAPDAPLRGMVFWLMGDLNGVSHWVVVWCALLVALALVWPSAHELDWMARGEAWSVTLGVQVARRRRIGLLAASLATAAAVACAGAVGFVGLVVPHALRLMGVRAAPLLLPASALAGGSFLVLADTLARTAWAPLQLPVGIVSAAVGVPSFIALLMHRPSGATA